MKKKKIQFKNDAVVIYKKAGKPQLQVKVEKETVWLTQEQIALLFATQRPAITKHLKNIFNSGELNKNSVSSILEHTATDGKKYKTQFYNLDAIISVGYRVNSKRATEFRIWATRVLREYLVKGYAVNEKRLSETGLKEFEQTIKLLKTAMGAKKLNSSEAQGLLQIITQYSETWLLLQKYDENKILAPKKKTKAKFKIDYQKAVIAIADLKKDLSIKKQNTELFGQERDGMFMGIIKNIYQTFGAKELYPSLEEKAAHLLYFIIKDHPFVDGNKRIASLLFIIFLQNNNYHLDQNGGLKFNSNALVALALLIAESQPEQKEIMVKLIMNFIAS